MKTALFLTLSSMLILCSCTEPCEENNYGWLLIRNRTNNDYRLVIDDIAIGNLEAGENHYEQYDAGLRKVEVFTSSGARFGRSDVELDACETDGVDINP